MDYTIKTQNDSVRADLLRGAARIGREKILCLSQVQKKKNFSVIFLSNKKRFADFFSGKFSVIITVAEVDLT